MLTAIAAVIGGLLLLGWSADRFIYGAAQTAIRLKVPRLSIGLIIVGIGTSAPEAFVSLSAALAGNSGIAIGNVYGSNITNIALVLGVTALIMPLIVHSDLLHRQLPMLLLINIGVMALMADGVLGRVDGVILLAGLLLVIYLLVRLSRSASPRDPVKAEFDIELKKEISLLRALVWVLVGLLVLIASARLLVWGAVNIALDLGVSDLVIGLTVVAVGTSLPELAASVTAALKGEHELAVGNVVGSNMFNFLLVLAMPALFAPGPFDSALLYRDAPLALVLTVILLLMARGLRGRRGYIMRWQGALLLTVFVSYLVFIYYGSLV